MTIETCPECGWARRSVAPPDSVVALRTIAAGYRETIGSVQERTASSDMIRRRPSPDVWSIAEYLAHTADAMEHLGRRAHLILSDEDPELPRFGDPNAYDYSAADVGQALARVEAACADLADVFGSATPSELDRSGHNALGAASLLDTAGYAVHEAGHHLHDIQQIARTLMST